MGKKVVERCLNKECKNCNECSYSNRCSDIFKNRKMYIDQLFNACVKRGK